MVSISSMISFYTSGLISYQVHLRRHRNGCLCCGRHSSHHFVKCKIIGHPLAVYLLLFSAVIHLVSRLPFPLAFHHRHRRCSSYLHDLGVESRVRLIQTCRDFSFHCTDLIDTCSLLCQRPFSILFLWNRRSNIIWECQNGGQLWGSSAEAGYGNSSGFPDAVCNPGFQSTFTAFIISLLVDLGIQASNPACRFLNDINRFVTPQMYMYFMNWRFMKRLEHYTKMNGPFGKLSFTLYHQIQKSMWLPCAVWTHPIISMSISMEDTFSYRDLFCMARCVSIQIQGPGKSRLAHNCG